MISVVIAAYNGARFIEKQLESIRAQILPVDEVLICDDRSTDNTVQICKEFIRKNALSGWSVTINEKNVGYSLNFFGGIARAMGDVIFLADQDDEWYKDKTEKMCAVLNEHSEIKVLSSRYDVIDADSQIIEHPSVPYLGECFDGSIEPVTFESLIGCSYIRGFATCFRSELRPYIKPMNLSALLSHDWYINSIGALVGVSAVLNIKLCGYRYHGDNVSLADMTRRTFLGDRQKRVDGLLQSVEAHTYLAENFAVPKKEKKRLFHMIRFEKKRIRFLTEKNFFVWLSLAFYPGCYRRYYKSISGAIRVFVGDFCYGYNINFKK